MRPIACFAVLAISFLALPVNGSAVLAAEGAAASLPKQASAPATLATRVYHLKYIAKNDLEKSIAPVLSQRGKTESPQADRATIVVYDYEQVLQAVDRLVRQVDVPPKQVLIEAKLVRIDSYKGPRTTGSSILARALNAQSTGTKADGSNAAAASAHAVGNKPINAARGFVGDTRAIELGFGNLGVVGSSTDFIHTLEALAEIKVIGSPRLLVLNKQRAEIHFGSPGVVNLAILGRTGDQSRAESSPAAEPSGTETRLRLRPFVSSDDAMVRLEVHLECCTRETDTNGILQTNTSQVTSNVMIPDGKTLVIGGLMDTEAAPGMKQSASAKSATQKELLVILSPHISKPASALNAEVSHADNFARNSVSRLP